MLHSRFCGAAAPAVWPLRACVLATLPALSACGGDNAPVAEEVVETAPVVVPAAPAGLGYADSAPLPDVPAFVDDAHTNQRDNTCMVGVATNAGVRVLSALLDIWTPGTQIVDAGVKLAAANGCPAATLHSRGCEHPGPQRRRQQHRAANPGFGQVAAFVQSMGNNASTEPGKRFYKYARPRRWSHGVLVQPTLLPARSGTPATDGGFPSGRTAESARNAIAMAYVGPGRFQEMLARGLELGENRIVAGMHLPLDVIGGRGWARPRHWATSTPPRPKPGLPPTPRPAGAARRSRREDGRGVPRRGAGAGHGPRPGRRHLPPPPDLRLPADRPRRQGRGGFHATDTWRNAIGGAGKLTKLGSGSLTPAGSNAYSGGTQVQAGTLLGRFGRIELPAGVNASPVYEAGGMSLRVQ